VEPITITIAGFFVGKILDELAAKSKSKRFKKLRDYPGIFSLIARIFITKK